MNELLEGLSKQAEDLSCWKQLLDFLWGEGEGEEWVAQEEKERS